MKTDLRIQKTYKLLVDSLIQLLKEKPFESIKLTEICELAMVHKTTFYNHFLDKYDLLKYAIKELQKNMTNQVKSNNNIVEYYLDLINVYMKHIKENKDFYYPILYDSKNSICLNIFYETFSNDIKSKLSTDNIDIPLEYFLTYHLNGSFQVINDWFKKGMIEDEKTIINYLKTIISKNIKN